MPAESPPPPHLDRRLGFWASLGIVIGITIGSGIFRTPASIAARVADPPLMLFVWVVGGLMVLCGALAFAELASSYPKAGGLYVFLREGWGRREAFLFGWSELILIRASANGAMATVFAEYFLRSIGVASSTAAGATGSVAALALIVAAVLNIRGVRVAAIVTGISTATKFAALALLVAVSLLLGDGAGASTAHFHSGQQTVEPSLFGLALISVLWAYDGFADLSFASGEVRDPQRTLPRAIVAGTGAIILIYLLTNAAYLYMSPVGDVARSQLIAADTLQKLFGRVGVAAISVVVAVSTFGSLVGTMLAAPRVFFAMADDRLFFASVARVHPRYHTPHVAILLCMALGVLFVLTRTFEQLADTFVLAIWPFYALAVGGLYRLRNRGGPEPRPFSTPGYPVVPAVFIAAAVYLVATAIVADPVRTGLTFATILAGVPVYYTLFAPKDDRVLRNSGSDSRRRPPTSR